MNIAAFNWIDFTVLGIVGFSVLISLVRGFIREAISLATWVLAIWVAYKYGQPFGQSVLTMVASDQAKYWIGAAILFFGILIIGAFLNFTISRFIFFSGLSALDRIIGMAFGFARGVLLVAVLILVAEVTEFDKNAGWSASQMVPQFTPLTEWLKSFVPEQFEKLKQKQEAGTQKPPATPTAEQPAAQSTSQAVVDAVEKGVSKLAPTESTTTPPVNAAPVSPSPH